MKILIPYDVCTTGMKNPYLFLLMRELVGNSDIESVQHGYGWLDEKGEWDVIHLHWPELLVKAKLTDMSRTDLLTDLHFEGTLDAIREKKSEGSKVILTVHNEKPHKDRDGQFDSFYRSIFELSDGFIHMGEASRKLTEGDYQEEIYKKPAFVIPHGDYSWFPNGMKRSDCRRRLGIEEDEKLLLSFGAIRTQRELELGIDAFRKAGVTGSSYMMVGQLPYPYKSQPKHFLVRRKLYLNLFNRQIQTEEKVIGPAQVQLYLKAADLLLIPRFKPLNSGNVALGFTFGKVVAGPDYGVVGEVLNETDNPVFDAESLTSVAGAIREGFELAIEGHGVRNREYAEEKMSWKELSRKTLDAYHSL